jgi:transposase
VKHVRTVAGEERCGEKLSEKALTEWVADKGYHANSTMEMVEACGLRSYVSEPARGTRRWKDRSNARAGTYANRRRLSTKRGRALMRRRGELLERGFAHCLETGGMRRVHLRGRENILKRYLVHVAAFNLSLVMRVMLGVGTPRGLARRAAALVDALIALCASLLGHAAHELRLLGASLTGNHGVAPTPSSTGC